MVESSESVDPISDHISLHVFETKALTLNQTALSTSSSFDIEQDDDDDDDGRRRGKLLHITPFTLQHNASNIITEQPIFAAIQQCADGCRSFISSDTDTFMHFMLYKSRPDNGRFAKALMEWFGHSSTSVSQRKANTKVAHSGAMEIHFAKDHLACQLQRHKGPSIHSLHTFFFSMFASLNTI